MSKFDTLIENLKKKCYKKIYVSHEPWQEPEARDFGQRLRERGFNVFLGADARSHKDNPHDEKDLEVVREVITSCDVVVVYRKEYEKEKAKHES
jgi:hypothetical protein